MTGTIPAFLLLTGNWTEQRRLVAIAPRGLRCRGLRRPLPRLRQAARPAAPPAPAGIAVDTASLDASTVVHHQGIPFKIPPKGAHDAQVVFPLDSTKKFTDQKNVGHNRWHPDIPANVTVKPGDVFRVDCREWFDGAIVNDDSADDILNAPLTTVHVLSAARSPSRAPSPVTC